MDEFNIQNNCVSQFEQTDLIQYYLLRFLVWLGSFSTASCILVSNKSPSTALKRLKTMNYSFIVVAYVKITSLSTLLVSLISKLNICPTSKLYNFAIGSGTINACSFLILVNFIVRTTMMGVVRYFSMNKICLHVYK